MVQVELLEWDLGFCSLVGLIFQLVKEGLEWENGL